MTRTPRSIADRYVDALCDLDRALAADPSLGPGSTDGDPVEPALRPAAGHSRAGDQLQAGERAWLAGRAAAREARGADFDLKAWHMAALSQGSLGLDDLAAELARL